MTNNIEVELRAVVEHTDFDRVLRFLATQGLMTSKTHRLMVMFFGEASGQEMDIRVRITNGAAELVMKQGDRYGHNRIEEAQPIFKEQMVGLARVISLLNYRSKVGEREIFNFDLGNGVTASLVAAGEICYLEYEKMSNAAEADQVKITLEKMMVAVGLPIIASKEEFQVLTNRLTNEVDWKFTGSPDDCARLHEQLINF